MRIARHSRKIRLTRVIAVAAIVFVAAAVPMILGVRNEFVIFLIVGVVMFALFFTIKREH